MPHLQIIRVSMQGALVMDLSIEKQSVMALKNQKRLFGGTNFYATIGSSRQAEHRRLHGIAAFSANSPDGEHVKKRGLHRAS